MFRNWRANLPSAVPARRRAHERVFFCSSGSEGVEAAIKFARAYTKRTGLIYAQGAFHGLTCGALSLMGDPFWSEGFGPMLSDTSQVPFGDLDALERARRDPQIRRVLPRADPGRGGHPDSGSGYLRRAQEICRRYGTLLVLDEVQTGLYRSGRFLAAHRYGADPDIVILAKALSGGLVPVRRRFDDARNLRFRLQFTQALDRPYVHIQREQPRHARRSGDARRARSEDLGARAEIMGEYLRGRLREALGGYEMVKEVRGAGLLNGIEFQRPRSIKLRVAFEAFRRDPSGSVRAGAGHAPVPGL